MGVTGHARRLVAPVGRPLRRAAIGLRTRDWPSYSRLFFLHDREGWVLAHEARQLARVASSLGVAVGPSGWARGVSGQSIFHLSQFTALLHDPSGHGNRLGLSYFHGRPGTPGFPEFDACYDALRRRHAEVDRVQVTSAEMEELVVGAGVAPERVHRIPIGIDVEAFGLRTTETRSAARRSFDLPEASFVVGSFQKDGVGWGEGLEPKLIKGPDVLLEVVRRLRERVPELVVLVTGPARGYLKAGLERLGVPYRHVLLPDVDAVARAYEAIDLCLVTSRDEGGPRAVLEAMAIGVPLVTTRVGQAPELVRHGENGWMVDVDDVEGLMEWGAHVAGAGVEQLGRVAREGRATAEANSYEALRPRWRDLLEGFVELPGSGREPGQTVKRASQSCDDVSDTDC